MNARRFFVLFFLCALVPFAAAKLSLSFGWFTGGATNKGQWVEREIQLMPAIQKGDMHWTIAYVNAEKCVEKCTEALYLLQQLHAGLGRKQLGVQAAYIGIHLFSSGDTNEHLALLKHHQHPLAAQFNHQFVIINQQGIVLLRYPLTDKPLPETASDLRSDLLRLFNYDRSRL